jgi:ATP-dependent exoDNAse (exonuclease V) beta subunit
LTALTGRLVHRLLQLGAPSEGQGGSDSRHLLQTAYALLQEEELGAAAGVDEMQAAVEDAVRMCEAIRRHRSFATLEAGSCLFEVPFSFRRAGESVILRGAIDCLARTADGALAVLEFKTGRPHPDHRAQLEAYVAAARLLFPGERVEGVLVYP